jgi:hypothetical protein
VSHGATPEFTGHQPVSLLLFPLPTLVSPDDDLALTLGQDLPAQCLRPEPGQPGQVVSVNDDVMESDRHAVQYARARG